MLLQFLLAFLPPDISQIVLMYLQNHPLIEVFQSTRLSCTFYHKDGGCLNCLSYGPESCRPYNTEYVTLRMTDIFDTAVLHLNQSPVHVFRCYLDERRRLRRQLAHARDTYNRVLDELLSVTTSTA